MSRAGSLAEKHRLTLAERGAIRRDVFHAARDAVKADPTPANHLALDKAKQSYFSHLTPDEVDAINASFLARVCAEPAAKRTAIVASIADENCMAPQQVWARIAKAIESNSPGATAARALMVADLASLADLAKSLGDAKGAVAAHQLSAKLQGLEAPTQVQIAAVEAEPLPDHMVAALAEEIPLAGSLMMERLYWTEDEKKELRAFAAAVVAEIAARRMPRLAQPDITARELPEQAYRRPPATEKLPTRDTPRLT